MQVVQVNRRRKGGQHRGSSIQ